MPHADRRDLADALAYALRYQGRKRVHNADEIISDIVAKRLILDDWGLEPLDAAARRDLLEILEERYGRRSTIITSQIPVDKWHELIGGPTYADAILDRVIHNAYRIDLAGESLRKRRSSP